MISFFLFFWTRPTHYQQKKNLLFLGAFQKSLWRGSNVVCNHCSEGCHSFPPRWWDLTPQPCAVSALLSVPYSTCCPKEMKNKTKKPRSNNNNKTTKNPTLSVEITLKKNSSLTWNTYFLLLTVLVAVGVCVCITCTSVLMERGEGILLADKKLTQVTRAVCSVAA